eukprot:scaffold645_cov247-Pinguiococcus_pyrenoidosus.AAC.3
MGQLLIEDVSLVKPRDVDAQAVVEAVQAQHVSLQHRRVEQILEAWTTLQLLMPAHGCAISIVIRPCSMELKLRRPQELLAELLDVVFMRSNSVRGHACRTCQRVCEVRRGLWDRIRVPQHEAQYGEKDLVAGNHIHLPFSFGRQRSDEALGTLDVGSFSALQYLPACWVLRTAGKSSTEPK